MEDLEKMTTDEKRRYIFEDTSFEGRPRSKWIIDCLLGDIQTFFDGIEIFIKNKEKSGKREGGGNLSVPILISTALEFVAALYAGKTNYILCFSEDISEELREEWNQLKIENLTNRLREMIKSKGLKINERATIASISKNRIEIDKYQIKKEGGKLNVYENYNATDNVRTFIKDFFPKEYKGIPLLLWDGVRNGLVHSFYPKSFSFQRSSQRSERYIQFQFYVEDKNISSHFNKDNDTIWICINVFELYRVVKKAIEDYLDKLKHDETLQDRFIKAWSSVEDYRDKADSNQLDEIEKLKKLLDYLDLNSAAPILRE